MKAPSGAHPAPEPAGTPAPDWHGLDLQRRVRGLPFVVRVSASQPFSSRLLDSWATQVRAQHPVRSFWQVYTGDVQMQLRDGAPDIRTRGVFSKQLV